MVRYIESRLEILSDSGFETSKAFPTLIVFPGVFNLYPLFSEGTPRPNDGQRFHDKPWTGIGLKPTVFKFLGCFLRSLQPDLRTLGRQAAWAFVSSMALQLMVSLCMTQAWQMQLLVTSCPGLNLFTVTTPTSPVRRSWVIEWTKQELDLGS